MGILLGCFVAVFFEGMAILRLLGYSLLIRLVINDGKSGKIPDVIGEVSYIDWKYVYYLLKLSGHLV